MALNVGRDTPYALPCWTVRTKKAWAVLQRLQEVRLAHMLWGLFRPQELSQPCCYYFLIGPAHLLLYALSWHYLTSNTCSNHGLLSDPTSA